MSWRCLPIGPSSSRDDLVRTCHIHQPLSKGNNQAEGAIAGNSFHSEISQGLSSSIGESSLDSDMVCHEPRHQPGQCVILYSLFGVTLDEIDFSRWTVIITIIILVILFRQSCRMESGVADCIL